MKMFFRVAALFCGLLVTQFSYADQYQQNQNYYQNQNQNFSGGQGQANGCCPPDAACDEPVNDCWCKYVHYEPCYYNTKRCVEEQVPCKKRCCRYVDKYYECQKCRYVPQYYTETYCKKVPEYYDVEEYKTCKKYVTDTKCEYVPKYYWKHVCGKQGCPTPCPTQAPASCCR